nr:hypothetical protein [Tanacetum cinerariifolium]
LRAQLFDTVSDQKDTTRGTSANTKFAKQSILRKLPKVGETHALSKPVTSNSIPTPQESKVGKNDKVIAPGMFRINPFKPSREEKHVPNKVRASIWTKPITVLQSPVFTKKVLNSDSNGLSSTRVDNTKTRRPQPRSNTKNDRVPSASKSSCNKNKKVKVEEHHRKLLLSRNKKHMSSECTTEGQKKIIETMNVSFNELSAMAFEQCSSKPGLQSMTSGQISSGLDLTYAPSTITQQPTKGELNLLFEGMYDDYIGGQPSSAPRIVPAAQAHQIRQTTTTSTSIADTALTPTISSSQATNFPNPSQDVDGLISPKQHAQQQGNQAPLQPETVADNVPNAMFDANTFVSPFANSLTGDFSTLFTCKLFKQYKNILFK